MILSCVSYLHAYKLSETSTVLRVLKFRLNLSRWKLVGDAISEIVTVGLCACFVNES